MPRAHIATISNGGGERERGKERNRERSRTPTRVQEIPLFRSWNASHKCAVRVCMRRDRTMVPGSDAQITIAALSVVHRPKETDEWPLHCGDERKIADP